MKDKKTINAEAAKAAADDIHASSIPTAAFSFSWNDPLYYE